MPKRLIHVLLTIEFLVALQAVFTAWSQVGGQYHLDLMFWPWKLLLGVGAASLIVFLTAEVSREGGGWTRRALLLCSMLIVSLLLAGTITYFYHLYEPSDDEEQQQDQPVHALQL